MDIKQKITKLGKNPRKTIKIMEKKIIKFVRRFVKNNHAYLFSKNFYSFTNNIFHYIMELDTFIINTLKEKMNEKVEREWPRDTVLGSFYKKQLTPTSYETVIKLAKKNK